MLKPHVTNSAVCGITSTIVPLLTYMVPTFTLMSSVHQTMLVIYAMNSECLRAPMLTTKCVNNQGLTERRDEMLPNLNNNDRTLNLFNSNKQILTIIIVIIYLLLSQQLLTEIIII